jgi:hypothetical protein
MRERQLASPLESAEELKESVMKFNVIRYTMIVMLIGLIALAAGRANAQSAHRNEIHIESLSWGMSWGQTARASVANFVFLDGSDRTSHAVIARIQLLDMEGEMIVESDEMRVEPGKTRFWDVSRDQMWLEGETGTGRIQVRARIVVTTSSFDERQQPRLGATLEVIDSATGRTVSYNPFITVDYLEDID